MKIVALNETDIRGGAARASYRLHQGLQNLGLDSQLLVREKLTQDPTVTPVRSPWTKLGPRMNRLAYWPYPRRRTNLFCSQWFPDAVWPAVRDQNPDVIQLHWVTNGFLRLETLAKFDRPLVWTLHDLWPFTGGCHYPVSGGDDRFCDRYQRGCGSCPALGSRNPADLSARTWQRKARSWQNLNLHLVAPSQWLAHIAQNHPILGRYPVHTIPLGLNLARFQPHPQPLARQQLNLPPDAFLIGFGALGAVEDDRKGFDLLRAALGVLAQRVDLGRSIALVVMGSDRVPEGLPYPTYPLGMLRRDEDLAIAYSALDVMVVPSRQETFGQMVSESQACGTPVVAFKAHAMPDLIVHQQNGYLAQAFDVQDLAQGLMWILKATPQPLHHAARQQALDHFSEILQAERYRDLYGSLYSS